MFLSLSNRKRKFNINHLDKHKKHQNQQSYDYASQYPHFLFLNKERKSRIWFFDNNFYCKDRCIFIFNNF